MKDIKKAADFQTAFFMLFFTGCDPRHCWGRSVDLEKRCDLRRYLNGYRLTLPTAAPSCGREPFWATIIDSSSVNRCHSAIRRVDYVGIWALVHSPNCGERVLHTIITMSGTVAAVRPNGLFINPHFFRHRLSSIRFGARYFGASLTDGDHLGSALSGSATV
jgi:hypothetical protein